MELLIVVAIIGILAMIAIPNLIVAIQRAKQKRTMTDMRNIATAWEARAGDMAGYNAAGVAGISVLISGDNLAILIQPTYIKSAPIKDGWGNQLEFFTDLDIGDVGKAQKYAIESAGRNGVFEATPTLGPISNFDCDIIYSNGLFLSYPP